MRHPVKVGVVLSVHSYPYIYDVQASFAVVASRHFYCRVYSLYAICYMLYAHDGVFYLLSMTSVKCFVKYPTASLVLLH